MLSVSPKKLAIFNLALLFFAVLGVSLSLNFKEKGFYAYTSIAKETQKAQLDTSPGFIIKNTNPLVIEQAPAWAQEYYNNADKYAQNSNFSADQIKQAVRKVLSQEGISSGGGCMASSGGISVAHSSCSPPGRGKCAGNMEEPEKKDLCSCSVGGVKGGSVTAMCMAGCCVQLSVSGPAGAFGQSGLSGGQLLQLGAKMFGGLLQNMMQGGGGGDSGGYNPNYYNDYNNYDYLRNTEPASTGLFDSQLIDSATSIDFNESDTTPVVTDEYVSTENVQTDLNNPVQDEIESLVSQLEQRDVNTTANNTEYELNQSNEQTEQDVTIDSNSSEYSINQDYFQEQEEFQDLSQDKEDNPKLAELYDPNSSKIASFKNRQDEQNKIYEPDFAPEKSWWQKLLEFIFGK